MEDALGKLSDIEAAKRLFTYFDPTYLKVVTEKLQREYADIMAVLLEGMMIVEATKTAL